MTGERAARRPTEAANRVTAIFSRLRAGNPEPRSELVFETPFQLLAAVMLSAQTTDRAVNRASGPLFKAAPTPAAMFALGEEAVARAIESIGLYKTKARHLVAASRLLLERHGGEVPRQREALEALPGVGRKTANVVLNAAFGEAVMAVDTHIFRVARRLGLSAGATPRAVENDLCHVIPDEFMKDAHHWLILHGRYVCKARKPECLRCVLADLCPWPEKTESGK